MATFQDIIKRAKLRETTVPVYLAGDVVAEIERLERQLAEAGADTWTADSLAATDPTKKIAEKIAAARKRLKASEVEFRFRALPDAAWSDLLAAHSARSDKELWNLDTFPRAVISASCIDPVMKPEDVDELFTVLSQGQRNELFNGAYSVNTESTNLPFSVSASGILASLTDGK